LGVNEILALFGTGILGALLYFVKKGSSNQKALLPFLLIPKMGANIGGLKIFLTFLKIGAILYGSGYVLFAFLDAELVNAGWLTRQELLDAVAVGQITPGPVLTTASFIGWQMNGLTGAVLATVGIFLPSFLFVLLLNPLIPKMRKSKIISAILNAVNVAAVALIVAVCIEMSKETLTDWRTILIALVSIGIVFYFKKFNSAYLVILAAIAGYILYLI